MDNEKDIIIESETDTDNVKDPAEAIKKLKGELSACRKEREEYLAGWQRAKADFINARKDEEKARGAFIKFANEAFVAELLPVLQNFERAMGTAETREKIDANWRVGIEHIYGQFRGALLKAGVSPIEPKVGDAFDGNKHASIGVVPVAEQSQNHTVREVVEKGFALHGKILEPAKVKIGEYKPQ
ncbi:MAG: molecular chaperone GrpE [Parcubacteria group bacterium Gr01-1014_17]|nr:MAG: molecular chaperone GrpE [Parcubacteria group bacterium Gr01-1014_17]